MEDKGKKKWRALFTRENMIVLTLLGILLLVIAIPVEEKSETKSSESGLLDTNDVTMDADGQLFQESLETQLETRLASFLSCMEGAGEVKVFITFSASEEQVVEKDVETSGWQETDGILPQSQETVFTTDRQGTSVPYVKKTLAACVEGVTVLAQGGDSQLIQKQITEMIEALFDIEAHKIRVAKMK